MPNNLTKKKIINESSEISSVGRDNVLYIQGVGVRISVILLIHLMVEFLVTKLLNQKKKLTIILPKNKYIFCLAVDLYIYSN
jgi:hypothetical protein